VILDDFTANFKDDHVEIEIGGWRTPHLKEILNILLEPYECSISSIKGNWYLTSKKLFILSNHFKVFNSGTIEGCLPISSDFNLQAQEIEEYAAKYLGVWYTGKIPPPGPGDPWFLYKQCILPGPLKEDEKLHMQMYIRKHYYVGSILIASLMGIDLGIVDEKLVKDWLLKGVPPKCKLTEVSLPGLQKYVSTYLMRLII
jgi:hypothetical protein